MDVNVKYIIEAVAKLRGLQQATREMRTAEQTARQLSRTMSKSAQFMQSSTVTAFTKTRGEFQKTTATFQDGGKKVAVSFAGTGQQAGLLREKVTSVSKSFKAGAGYAQHFSKALARVAIVVPIWFLFRQVISGVFRVLRDGIKDIGDFDRALQKARRNLQGSSAEITKNFKTLQSEVQALSKETGESVQDITTAFQRFATTGLDFETSMAGATASVKTAILLFGETEQVANAVARSFRVLGGRTSEYASKGEELEAFLAQIAELWKTNAFEINEFAGALERFAPTANTANISLKETAVLLASVQTGGLRGTRAGRLLATSFTRLVTSSEKLAKTLGVTINEELDTSFTLFLKVLDAVKRLDKEGRLSPAFQESIKDIFGRRAGEPVKALIALRDVLKQNMAITGDIEKFNKEFDEINKTTFRLTKQMSNLNKEAGRAFVTALVGGKNYNDTLQKVTGFQREMNSHQKSSVSITEALALSFKTLGAAVLFLPSLVATLASLGKIPLINPFAILSASQIKSFEIVTKQIEDFTNKTLKGLKGELSKKELIKFIASFAEEAKRLEGISFGDFEVSEGALVNTIGQLRKKLKELTEAEPVELSAILTPKEALEVPEFAVTQKIVKAIIDSQLARLKTQGALNSEILKARTFLSQQLGLIEDETDILKRQLKLEQEITAERKLRSSLSSETIKLFKIAQTKGVDMARTIGDALSGEIDFSNFVRRGGEAVEVFKKEFSSLFEQQQALAFFKGNTVPGLPGLRGGAGIPIEEKALRTPVRRYDATAFLETRKAIRRYQDIKAEIETRVDVHVDVTGLDYSKVIEKVKLDVADDIANKASSEIGKSITKRLEEF